MRLFCASLMFTAPAFAAPAEVTYYKDALPVIEKNCQSCHRPGEPGPMSLLTYESTRPWAKAIRQAVSSRTMPPWLRIRRTASSPTTVRFPRPISRRWWRGWTEARRPAIRTMRRNRCIYRWLDDRQAGRGVPDPAAFKVPKSGTIDYQYW